MSSTLRIRLLGDFSLDFDDAPVSTINTPRLQSLLAYLLLHREAPQPRGHVAYTLWPDSTDAQARSNLRTLLTRLRDALPNAEGFLQADAHTLQWRAEGPFTLDVAEFEDYAHPANSPLPVRESLERASAAYGGDLLPGCYDDWILPERERLRQMFYDVLERLILLSEDQRDYQRAIYHGQRLLRHEPLHEATYRRLMRLHALNGDRAGALRVYHTCVTVLERELAVEPGPSTQEAYQRLLMREETATSPPTTPVPLSPLVGRDQEWSRLQATWRRAAAGRASFALLSGEAGIGKTRLAEELVEWANRQGVVTASARCYATEGELAFGPIVAWMRTRALPPLDDVWLTEVARLLPELLAERPDLPTPGPLTQAWQRQRLFEALARGILGHKGPILLVIDDLQWCDRGTLEWLHFFLRFDPRARLLLVGTARSEELHDDHPLASLLLDLRRVDQLVEIELSTLDLTATRALAASVAGRELALAHAAELHQEAEGNPLFVIEMVRSGLPGEDRVRSGALPAKVEAVIKARLNQLSPSARELVGVAATVGRAFTFDVLAQASGGDEETLVGALDQLWGRRIVREQGADAYDFSHHKIREVAYAELSLARRRLLHRQVAQALEKVYVSDLDAVSRQVARHYERSGMSGQAVPYFRRAAEVAERIYAHEETMDYLQRALRLHQALTPAESAKERHQEMAVQLHERLGDVLHLTGAQDQALGAYRDALDNVWEQCWISRARLHRKLGNIWREKHQYHQALRAYETAETTLEEESARAKQEQLPLDYWQEWVQLQLERMWVYYWLDQWHKIANLEDEIRGTVEQFGTPAQHVNFLNYSAMLHLLRDRYVASDVVISNAQAALAISQTSSSIGELAWVRFLLGFGQLWRGDLDKAEEQMLAALKVAETTGDIVHQSRCLTYLTVLYRKRGQVDCVQAYAARSLSMAEAAEMPEYVGTARANQAYVAWHLGDYAGSRAHGQAALASWHQLPASHASCSFQWTALWPLIAITLADGELSEAIEYARILLEPSQQRLPDPLARAVEQAIDGWENDQLDEVETHLGLAVSLAQESSYL